MSITDSQEVIYRINDTIQISGKQKSTIYKEVRDGTFPAPVRLGPQSVGWRKSDLDVWLAALAPAGRRRSLEENKIDAVASKRRARG